MTNPLGDGTPRRRSRARRAEGGRGARFAPFLLVLLLAPPSAGAAATAPHVDLEEAAPLPRVGDTPLEPWRTSAALVDAVRVRGTPAPAEAASADDLTQAAVRVTPPALWVPAKAGVNATVPMHAVDARVDPEHEGVQVNATPVGPAAVAPEDAPTVEPSAPARTAVDPIGSPARERVPDAAEPLARDLRDGAASPSAPDATPPPRDARAQAVAAPAGEPLAPPLATHRIAALAAGALALLLAPWLLYHRLRGARVLDQDTRSRVFGLIQERPGVIAVELARELDLDRTTVRYHLRRLEREGLICTEGTAHFAAGALPRDARAACVAAARSSRVLDAVREQPGRAKNDLAEALGLARATVSWHLDRLAGAGLVRLAREGRAVRAYPVNPAEPKNPASAVDPTGGPA